MAEDSGKEEALSDKISKVMTGGGIAVAKTTGMVVGYSGKLLRVVKDKTTSLPLPSLPSLLSLPKGLFSGGVLKIWGGEKSNIKVNIAKARQRIDKLYLEIGKRGAKLSGVEDITDHESVKDLVSEVKSCEGQIQRWEQRLKDIDREQAEARRSRVKREATGEEADTEGIKSRIIDSIDKSMKSAKFQNSSEKAIFDKVTHDLLDDDVEIRLLAAAELGKVANPASIPILKDALAYRNVYLTSEIINALININDQSCLPVFKDNVGDENYRVRLGSLRGIYKLGGADSVPYLTDGLKDEHAEVRKSAATFIGWVGVKDAAPSLIQALKDSDQEVKKAAAMSLSILRDQSSVMPLIRVLKESSIEVREKVVHAIERITGKAVKFKIDASGEELKKNIENLKAWWQKDKMADVEEALEGAEVETEPEKEEETPEVPEATETEAPVEEAPVEETPTEEATETETAAGPAGDEPLTRETLENMLKNDIAQKCNEMGINYSPEDTKANLIKKILKKIKKNRKR